MTKAQDKKRARGLADLLTREFGALSGLILICIALSIAAPDSFPTAGNLLNILTQISYYAIIAAGMTFVIISGGIDLSVGSVLGFSACVGGYLQASLGLNGWIGILGALAAGLAFGLLNGVLVTRIGLQPFIVTLGTMGVARGLAMRITNGRTIVDLDGSFLYLGSKEVWVLPAAALAMVGVFIIGHIILTRMPVGRYTYAVGGNEEAARLSGVPVVRTKLFVYAFTGLLTAVAALIVAGRNGAVAGIDGDGFELYVIAAVVIGGTSLVGGQGRLVGSLIGALIMGVVRNGLNLLAVDANWQKVVIGAIILLAVTVDVMQRQGGFKAFLRSGLGARR